MEILSDMNFKFLSTFALILALVGSVTFAGCAGGSKTSDEGAGEAVTEEAVEMTEEAVEETGEAVTEEAVEMTEEAVEEVGEAATEEHHEEAAVEEHHGEAAH